MSSIDGAPASLCFTGDGGCTLPLQIRLLPNVGGLLSLPGCRGAEDGRQGGAAEQA
jgi:hypothetical protein